VAVLTPWVLYRRFGDVEILRRQYGSAKAWVDLVERLAGPDRLWNAGFQLGDWLDPAAPPNDPAGALTDRYLVATAYFAWSALHMSKIAGVLERTSDRQYYERLAEEVRSAFVKEYMRPDQRLSSDAQTAYALALEFDLFPSKEMRDRAAKRLAELVAEAGNRIATGFAGTPAIADALSKHGQLSTAYDLLLEQECPSWLYTVRQGGTTMWERWDALRPDGTVNPGQMTSFNHYAFGAIADWMHRTIGGIEAVEPGYRRLRIAPAPGGGLTRASARYDAPYGTISTDWTLEDRKFALTVVLPVGVTAEVVLPRGDASVIGAGKHMFTAAVG
jgi:alpha-L-rhamnosidase